MGWKNTAPIPLPADRDPNPFWKNLIGWLPDANITTTSTSDTYRIYAFDQPTLDANKRYALRIVRDPARTYWFSYRQSNWFNRRRIIYDTARHNDATRFDE